VVPGAYLIRADQEKQDPDFWYLTGVESPYAVLVIVRLGKLAGGSPVPSRRAPIRRSPVPDGGRTVPYRGLEPVRTR